MALHLCAKHLLGLIDEHRFEYTSGVVQIFLQCFRRDFTALQLTQKTAKSARDTQGGKNYCILQIILLGTGLPSRAENLPQGSLVAGIRRIDGR